MHKIDKFRVKWMEQLTPPQARDMGEDNLPFIKDRRQRPMEEKFNKQGVANWKIWSIQINKNIVTPPNLSPTPYMVKAPFEGEWLSN